MAKERQVGKFKSQSVRGVIYHVIRDSDGELKCDCPGFMYHNGKCKHIDSVKFKQTYDGSRKEEE